MFHSPWYLLLLLFIPLFAWRLWRRKPADALRFSTLRTAAAIPPSLRQRMLWLPPVLTLLALTLLIIGLARPREGRQQTITNDEGIAIALVVDRSSSMLAMDFDIDGSPVDRLTAIKYVAAKFVEGSGPLAGRISDLIGLISFAGYADSLTPLTLDHQFLIRRLNEAEIVDSRREDGTAIGDAVALAVEKLNALDSRRETPMPSKVIILLTDGENTAGELEPLPAAELAETMGIKIYTIGVGTKGEAPVPRRDPFSGRIVTQMMQVNIDEDTLREIAELTGGRYFRATDTKSLERIYEEIDGLEKVEVEANYYVDYRELAVQSIKTRFAELPPILLWAFGLLCLRIVLQHTWLRQLNPGS